MAYRIRYEYTEYKDYPEATAISESRSRNAQFVMIFSGFGILISLVCLFVSFADTWPMIFLLLICVLGLFSLFSGHYDVVTQKKIKKAIADRDKLMEEIRNPSYNCKAIKIVMKQKQGKCYMCKKNNCELFLCDIKRQKGSSVIPVCNDCVVRFKSNIK